MTKFDLSIYPNLLKAAELLDESNYNQAQLDAYDRHLLAVYDINRSNIESFDKGFEEGRNQTLSILKDLQEGTLLHHEIATKHGVELQVVIQIADSLR
jgi:hypothetical protein